MAQSEYERKVGIVLFGTDPAGDLFQEDTYTLVVSRHWMTARVRHTLTPGAEVIIFNKENGSQAEFFVEGPVGPNEVRLALRDHTVDIWQLDWGPPPFMPDEGLAEHIICSRCQTRESVRLSDTQIDELVGAGRLQRHCATCAAETDWEEESVVEARNALAARAVAHQAATPAPEKEEPAIVAAPPAPPAVEPKPAPVPEAVAVPVTPLAAPALSGAERRASKRIYLKTNARVRGPHTSEVVQPVNVSRGGICFESRSSYELDEVVFVAMHYRANDPAPLETPSRIVRVVGSHEHASLHSYGVKFEA